MIFLYHCFKKQLIFFATVLLVTSGCAATSRVSPVVSVNSIEGVFASFKAKNKKYSKYQLYPAKNFFQDIDKDGYKDAVFIMSKPKKAGGELGVVILKGLKNNSFKTWMISPDYLMSAHNFDVQVSGSIIKISSDYQGSVFGKSSDVFNEMVLKMQQDKLIIQRMMYDSSWELESAFPRTYYDYDLVKKTYTEGWPVEKYNPELKANDTVGFEGEGKLQIRNGNQIIYTNNKDLKSAGNFIATPFVIHRNIKRIRNSK